MKKINDAKYPSEVTIIKRNEIRAIHSIEIDGETHDLGEHRDFRRNTFLNQFLPEFARISLSWVHLDGNKVLSPHEHPTSSMIIVTKGQGELTGQKNSPIYEGDIVIVPPNCQHGFIGKNSEGLTCISVQFGNEGGLYENTENPLVNFIK